MGASMMMVRWLFHRDLILRSSRCENEAGRKLVRLRGGRAALQLVMITIERRKSQLLDTAPSAKTPRQR